MRKQSTLLIAATLVVAGLALMAASLFLIDFDFKKFGASAYTEGTLELSNSFTSLDIKVDDADLRLVATTDGSYRVVYKSQERVTYTAAVKDGLLTVSYTDDRAWNDYLGFYLEASTVTVYMPAGVYDRLVIHGRTGSVVIPSDFSFTDVEVTISTGDIHCSSSASREMQLATTTGEIDVNGVTVGILSLKSSTGDIEMDGISCAGDMTVQVSSGDVELRDVTCGSLTLNGSTGDLALVRVLARSQMKMVCTTGDVELSDVEAGALETETDTGDVIGSLRTPKQFDVHTGTGSVRVPQSGGGGICRIRTSTGDISIRIL